MPLTSEPDPVPTAEDLERVEIELERDLFLRQLTSGLAETLENVVGLEEASGFVSVVGQQIGEWIDQQYRRALGTEEFDVGQLAAVLVDLKRRIQGDFYIIEQDEGKIVLGNRACPFGELVKSRPSLCMMTSNVFGHIASQNLGYAKVELEETIARGHSGCRVVVYLRHTPESAASQGHEYVRI